jgi:hypothetical protein
MALQYLFDPNKQFQSRNGVNAVNGFLRVYLNGTDDRATTYRNFDGGLNEPDIVLDTDGRAVVIVDDTKTYRLEVYSPTGAPQWTVENYKARGGSGGSGTPVSVEGTAGEIDVYENTVGGVKHFIVSLAENVKNAISSLTSAVNGIALTLGNKKERQNAKEFFGSTTKTVVGVSQNENGEMYATFDDIAFPDWTSAINEAVSVCEKTSNKKNTLTGYESSTTAYPTIKAVVDFVNAAMQNLGGKLITDNGDPFASSSALPTTTPYQGVDIADKDYAYIQGVGTAERWSATVSGTSVSWLQEYAISIPVFTPQQQAAIDSGVTSEMLGTFLTKTGDGSNVTATFTAAGSRTNISTGEKLSVIFGKIAKWFADLKSVAFSGSYNDLSNKPTIPAAANNGTLTIKQNGTSKGTFSANQSTDTEINVTDTTYESKPEASGGTAVSLVTTGDKYTWNHKQNALPITGTPSRTFAINVSGTARYSENVLPYYVSANNDKSWLEVGTYKANNTDEMYTGITFAVKFRSVDGHTQSGFMWISVGEWKSGGDYSNADIVCEYYTLGRRVKEPSDSVKLYVNILGTSVTDGVKIYAYLAGYSNISLTPLNVDKGTYTSSMTYLDAEPATKKEVNYCNLLRSTYGTAIGAVTSPVYVDQYGIVRECDPMAKKASSGNGNLAVIDSSGNYASSGISAYSQSQLNAAVENNVFPWLLDNSYVMTRSFWLTVTTSTTGKVMDFANLYTGEKLLRIGFNYVNDGDLQIYIPWNNAQWNQWIIDTSGSSEVGYVFVTANGTKHSDNAGADTVTPYFAQNESTLHSSGQSASVIGNYSIGTSTLYNTSSHYYFCIMLGNAESGKLVRLNLSAATKRYASGAKKAEIMVFATLDASGLNT